MSYQIVTDATSDLTPDLLAGLPPLAVVPMPVNIDGAPHSFGPGAILQWIPFTASCAMAVLALPL